MKIALRFTVLVTSISIASASLFMTVANAASATTEIQTTKQVMVINNSDVTLEPTAEGFANGCIGGSLPPVLNPVAPHTSRAITVLFAQYSDQCRFNMLPKPSMMTYSKACHAIQVNDIVTFTGKDISSLSCTTN